MLFAVDGDDVRVGGLGGLGEKSTDKRRDG